MNLNKCIRRDKKRDRTKKIKKFHRPIEADESKKTEDIHRKQEEELKEKRQNYGIELIVESVKVDDKWDKTYGKDKENV